MGPPTKLLNHLPDPAGKVPVSVPEFPVSFEKFPDPVFREFRPLRLVFNGKLGFSGAGRCEKRGNSLFFPADQGI